MNKVIPLNEQIIVYNIISSLLYHYEENGIIKTEPQIEIINFKKIKKVDKRIIKRLHKLIIEFAKNSNEYIDKLIYEKTDKTFKAIEGKYKNKQWAYLPFGLTLLENYLRKGNRNFLKDENVNSVVKDFELIKQDYKVKLLTDYILNSIDMGNNFFKRLEKWD